MEYPNRLAAALGVPELDDATVDEILDMAREVAHGSERRYAPISAFVAGLYAAGRVATGSSLAEAARTAKQTAADVLHRED